MDGLLFNDVQEYCRQHSRPSNPALPELERETNLTTVTPQMIAGPLQGKLLEMIVCMTRAKQILEIGSFTGYGAICLASGLVPGGCVHTIEVNPEREPLIRKYISIAQLEDSIELHIGDAFKVIPQLNMTFDLIFIDAGKRDNPEYYELAIEILNPGGVVIIDNVLWGGKVISDPGDNDAILISNLNKKISRDERVTSIMLPIRDGMSIAIKK